MTEITLCYDVCSELTQSARLFRAASQSMFALLALPLRLPLSLGSKGKFQSWTDGRTSAKLEAPSPYCLTLSSPLLQIHLLRFPSSWEQAILFPFVLKAGVLIEDYLIRKKKTAVHLK